MNAAISPEPFETARAHFVAGTEALQAGRLAEAEARLRASLEALPGRPSTLANLGTTLLRAGRGAEAVPLLEAALAAEPAQPELLGHLALALAAAGRGDEALGRLEQVQRLVPAHLAAWVHHAELAAQAGQLERALASNARVCELAPGLGPAWSQRGALLKDLGRGTEAVAALERAVALGDAVELNRWLIGSLTGQASSATPPDGYVEGLFDSYAEGFDAALEALGYRTPSVLVAMLAEAAPGRPSGGPPWPDALDLGCGTGLLAPLLKPAEGTASPSAPPAAPLPTRASPPLVGRLAGVDLSAGMLAKARERGGYDTLHHGDIVQHLQATAERFDLVLAADVFVYLGDLEAVFAGVARVLREGGAFAFSLERAAPDVPWVLQGSSRYAHGRAYVQQVAARHGFVALSEREGTLRRDHGRDVGGAWWLLQRGSAADPTGETHER